MKKSLIALAALAAVSAASAQSSVTLYGVVDIGYGAQKTQSRDGTTSSRSSGVMDGANAGNRIGFRGTEDLGGGLKANFVVEQGISPTSGNLFTQRAATAGQQGNNQYPTASTSILGSSSGFSTSTNRQSYIGLASDSIGTFNVGYQYTIGYELGTLSGYNIGSEGAPGAYTAHLHGTSYAGGNRANGLTYISPAFGGGFTVRAQYGALAANQAETSTVATAGATTAQATGRRYALMGQYANGPLSAALAYTNVRATTVATTAATATLGTTAGSAVTTTLGTTNLNQANRVGNLVQLGASYDFGVVKLAGTYNAGRDGGTASTTTSSRYRGYQIGLSAPFGAIVPFVTVGRAYVLADGAAARSVDVNQAQVGVRYSLSKRTTAYAFSGRTADNAAAAQVAYKDTKTIVGVAHSF